MKEKGIQMDLMKEGDCLVLINPVKAPVKLKAEPLVSVKSL
jgi:hypothetical protein